MESKKAGSEELAFLVSNRTAEGCAGIGGESFKMRDIRRTVETMLAGLGIRTGPSHSNGMRHLKLPRKFVHVQ